MPIDNDLKIRLLGAIEADSLVFLCGAGLSMAPPSLLPPALTIANECYDKWNLTEPMDPLLRDNLEGLADHFYVRGDFKDVFINRLIPWNSLVGSPNEGHAAIADMLICRAAKAALSANFDPLIENWAQDHKIAMRGALDGVEAVNFQFTSSPLIKFHGCLLRGREETIWTATQFGEAVLNHRKQTCSDWMKLNLPGRHLVVVGFWSDWGYLNDVLADAFSIATAASVTVVSPGDSASLETKAPLLWGKLHAMSHSFKHVQVSGDAFLSDLRQAFSEVWVRKFIHNGKTLLPAPLPAPLPLAIAAAAGAPPPMSQADLYDIRRDAEAVSYTSAATSKAPPPSTAEAASIRIRLIEKGALEHHSWLDLGGTLVRVISGAGRNIEDVKKAYKEPPTLPDAHVIVCAGATTLGVPGKLIAKGTPGSIIRPAAGSGSSWITTTDAEDLFGL
jgi:hypothetical protein